MSDVPKYREHGHSRFMRMSLGKPHVMWCRQMKTWVVARYGISRHMPYFDRAIRYCSDQDKRWTPVQKD